MERIGKNVIANLRATTTPGTTRSAWLVQRAVWIAVLWCGYFGAERAVGQALCDPFADQNYGVVEPSSCDDALGDPRDAGYSSVCWGGQDETNCESGGASTWPGFPSNLCLWHGVGPGDYPPRNLNPAESSAPMVSPGIRHYGGPVPYANRAMLGDVVDLVTGTPLLQETDFELPFGGSTFRHVRTYAEPALRGFNELSCHDNDDPSHLYLDWQGQGWMMGEAPIFLVDAGYWGVVGNDEGEAPRYGPRRCYFIPDAHHAIPFIWDHNSASYVAPAQFDAILTYSGGTYDPETQAWSTLPTAFTVWMHRRSVKYTIKPLWDEDVAPLLSPSHTGHDRPPAGRWNSSSDGGPGAPFQGLVTSIDDHYGNRLEIEYCGFEQFSADDPLTEPCEECAQNCHEKGQIRTVKLIANYGQTNDLGQPVETVVWSLAYTYRSFEDHSFANNSGSGYRWHRQQALHSIYAYDYDIHDYWAAQQPPVDPPACFTLDDSNFYPPLEDGSNGLVNDWNGDGQFTLHDLDAVDEEGILFELAGQQPVLPADWSYRARYLYADDGFRNNDQNEDESPKFEYTYEQLYGAVCPDTYKSPRLIKTTVDSRQDLGEPDAITSKTTLYRYDFQGGVSNTGDETTLKAILSSDIVDQLVGAGCWSDPGPWKTIDSAVDILLLSDGDRIGFDWDEGQQSYDRWEHLLKLADLRMYPWGFASAYYSNSGYFGTSQDVDQGLSSPTTFVYDMVANYIGLNKNRLGFLAGGPTVVAIQGYDGNPDGVYRIYRFLYGPPKLADDAGYLPPDNRPCHPSYGPLWDFLRALYHYPYRYIGTTSYAYDDQTDISPLSDPTWVVVVDQYETIEDCSADFGINGEVRQPLNRRVVQINAAGHIVSERTWAPFGSLASSEGVREEYRYDSRGRLAQRRTVGWGSSKNEMPTGEGLIHVFGYDGAASEVSRIGVKRGSSDDPIEYETDTRWLTKFVRDTDRPQLVTEQWAYPTPVDSSQLDDPSKATISKTAYTYNPEDVANPEKDEDEWRVQRKIAIKPSAQRSDASIDLYHATEMEFYDDSGRRLWKGYGSTLGDSGIPSEASGDQYFLDYALYVPQGSKEHDVHDAVPGIDARTGIEVPAYPDQFARMDPSGSAALSYVTQYEYANSRLRKVEYPNGRAKHVRYRKIGSQTHKWVYKDIVNNGATFKAYSPVEINYYDNGKLTSGLEATVVADGAEPDHRKDTFTTISTLTPSYDAQGNVTGLVKTGVDGQSVSAEIERDYFGQVSKEVHPDGTIMRTISDPLGRPDRTFRGTKDRHIFWGTDDGSAPDDDMVILQKTEYGDDVTNANQLTQVRHFREMPSQQYPVYDANGDLVDPNNEDEYGWLETHLYDWRMRDIWVTQYAKGVGGAQGPAMAHTITFLDHLDRPRFVASYGPVGPATNSDADPKSLAIGSDVPSAAAILVASVGTDMIGLSETIYNDRGQVQETRRYDVSTVNGLTYLSDRTFYDHNDKPLETFSSGGGKQVFTYDAKGRQTTARTYAGSWEVRRTETYYDADGNPEKTISYERMHDANPLSDLELIGSNSVVTYSFSWFNPKNQMIATASVGTASASGAFTNRTTPIDFGNGVPTGGITGNPPVSLDVNGMLVGVDASGFEVALQDSVQISAYEYDDQGRQVAVARSSGAVPGRVLSRTSYDDLGNVILTIENAAAAVEDQVRTGYFFDENNRLTKIAAVLPGHLLADVRYSHVNWGAADNTLQITEFVYGADVIDESTGAVVSANNGLIGQVKFPDQQDGQPNATADLTLTYYTDGTLATRTDARTGQYTHLYDELGRQLLTLIDDSGLPTLAGSEPVDRVNRIEYLYNTLNRLEAVTARSDILEASPVIAQNEFVYDSFGNLLTEAQQHGDVVQRDGGTGEITSPRIDYGWSLSSAEGGANHNRIASMMYPANAETAVRRTLNFEYGDGAADLDHLLSRLTTITDSLLGQLASYDHAGAGRRVSAAFSGGSILQTIPGGVASGGYTGLDRFGRVTDLDYTDNAATSLQRMEYAYDQSGNRLFSNLTQQDGSGLEVSNERSGLYAYDGLDRLVNAQSGVLNAGRTALEPTVGIAARSKTWTMDGLGNWVGDATDPGLRLERDANGDGIFEFTQDTDHDVGLDNRIEQLLINGSPTGLVYDASGSLVADGDYWYQYDAWGRQVRIDGRGTLGFNGDGSIASGTPGPWIAHYTYDGLGRLIAKQSPWTTGTDTRTERYHYDGIRRVSETFTDPVVATGPGALVDLAVGGGGTSGTTTWTSREYVYGPDYVDEFICQIDRYGVPFFVLQDGNYNVVGLTNALGQLLAQWTYDPYGEVLTAESFAAHPVNRIGHQGLFADRLDGLVTDDALLADVDLLYQNRNRTYSPKLGRFLQKDPNALAQQVVGSHWNRGNGPNTAPAALDGAAHFSDGMSTYASFRSNPLNATDPAGLFVDFLLPGPGDFITGALSSMVQEYAARLDWDMEWASDWSTGDDWHSRLDSKWVTMAWARGLYDAFTIEVPFTELEYNPLDVFGGASAGSFYQKTARMPRGGRATFARRVHWKNTYALLFTRPNGGRNLVKYPDSTVKLEARVKVTSADDEIREAQRKFGKSRRYKWKDEFGEQYVWHHHSWKPGVMQLVPLKLHAKIGHSGRTNW